MPTQTGLIPITTSVKVYRVQSDTLSLVRFIDQSLLKHEREMAKLRRARAILVARDAGPQDESEPPASEAVVNGLANPARKPDSVGNHLMSILQNEHEPLSMKTIHEKISERGKLVEYHTMTGMVRYYVKKGYVLRIGPNKYQIAPARQPANGAPTPKLTNGAPLPKNGVP